MGATEHDRQPPDPEPVERHPVTSTSKPEFGDGTSQAFDFFSSVIAGMLIGIFLDWMFGTAPVLVIIGVVAGFVSGFVKLWVASAAIESEARRRGRL